MHVGVVIDIYSRLILGRETSHDSAEGERTRSDVLVSRIATVGFGSLGTILAMNVSRIGSLLEIANKLINAFSRAAVRHLHPGDVQPAGDEQRRARRRHRRIG